MRLVFTVAAVLLLVAPRVAVANTARPQDALDAVPQWFVGVKDEPQGPLSGAEVEARIKTRKLRADSLAWREGMLEWTPLKDITRFKSLFKSPPPLPKAHASPSM